ncbi:hypothetical protein DUNSADRAFT_7885, partial [Dunaliella salina]
ATDPCNAGAMICLDIQLAVPYSDVVNADVDGSQGLVSSYRAQLESNQRMKDSLHGFGQAIMATEFKLSQPDKQDEQPSSDAPGRRLAQGDSAPLDCSNLDATLSRRLRDLIISESDCEREVVQPQVEGNPPGRDPSAPAPPGGGDDVIEEGPPVDDEDPGGGGGGGGSSSSSSSSDQLGLILGLALGLGLGIPALVGAVYVAVRMRRSKEDTAIAAFARLVRIHAGVPIGFLHLTQGTEMFHGTHHLRLRRQN